MKKVLLLSVCLIVSFMFGGKVWAQSSATVTFIQSDDNKTLTISGQGDLTTYKFVDETKWVFTKDGADNVATGQYNGPINVGDEYDSSKTYWKKGTQIQNNEKFFSENSTYIEHPSYSFSELLANEVNRGSYATVKFVNSGSDALTINVDIVSAILYSQDNSTVVTLDLGATTIDDLNSSVFLYNGETNWAWKAKELKKLENITLPKTKVVDGSMVLPSEIITSTFGIGEITWIKSITVPEGYTALGDKAFYNVSKIPTFNLPSTLTNIGASAFEGCGAMKEITLPDAVTYIGKKAFVGTKLTDFVFPANLDKVDDAAFFNVKIQKLNFNSKLRFIGNTAFGWDNNRDYNVQPITLTTLDIPESVKYIGPAAFSCHEYQDVYFHSVVAPIMPYGNSVTISSAQGVESTAFPSNTLMGNDGYNSSKTEGTTMDDPGKFGYANRENYKNNGYYIAILHYPKTLTAENDIDTYTDYTRKYWYTDKEWRSGISKDNDKTTVGYEKQDLVAFNKSAAREVTTGFKDTYVEGDYIWPSQNQMSRAYATAVNGVKWNGVDTYRTQLTQEELDILAEAGYKKGETTDEANGVYTLDQLQKMAHQGTRMFVLANNDSQNGNEYHISMKGGKWWTLCVPFNMTKKQVSDVFGDKTNVCLFNHVKRTISASQGNHISLYFTVDVCQRHTCKAENKNADGTWNTTAIEDTTAPSDDDIVIFAHESYMIRPSKTDDDAVFVVKNYEPEVGNPVPTVVTSVVDEYVQDADQENTPEYRFIGNYLASSKIPQYSYVYATKDAPAVADRKYKFWFITDGNMSWSPNKSVVQTNAHGGGAEDYNSFFYGNANSAKVKQASIFGTDDDTTGVENMVIIAGEGSDAPVYSVDGKMVNRHGDTTGLAKGVYIQNGKKFIVK